jgi:hypothetical protein
MRIHRGLLFWGLFLIPLGAVPLLARANAIDLGAIGQAWRFWPLILVAVGLALLLGRSRASIVATVVLALVLGSIAGATLATGPGWIASAVDCGVERPTDAQLDRNGSFSGPAEVNLDLRCGTVDLTTGAGSGWSVHASYAGATPTVDASDSKLEVEVPGDVGGQRQHWTVTAPVDGTDAIELRANAGTAKLLLEGANLSRIEADMNAGDLLIDGGSATIGRLDVQMNAGRARITLDDSAPVSGEVSMNAGAVDLCVPPGVELRLRTNDQLTFVNNLASRGLTRDGNVWHRAGAAGSPAIELSIEGNAANLTLDPDGGCK